MSLLEVPTEPAVTTAECLGDARPNQRVHDHSTGFDDQSVGEHRCTTHTRESCSLVTRSPVEPAGRALYKTSLLEHLELHGAAINRHHTEQQKPAAERGKSSVPERSKAVDNGRPRHLRERPQLIVRAGHPYDSIPHDGGWGLQCGDELDLNRHRRSLLDDGSRSNASADNSFGRWGVRL